MRKGTGTYKFPCLFFKIPPIVFNIFVLLHLKIFR